jgi:hypothetical protein
MHPLIIKTTIDVNNNKTEYKDNIILIINNIDFIQILTIL